MDASAQAVGRCWNVPTLAALPEIPIQATKVITSGVGWYMPEESGGLAPTFVRALSRSLLDLAVWRSLLINTSLWRPKLICLLTP